MAAMGHYSHVHNGSSPRPPGRLRTYDVTVMAMRAEVATIAFWRAVIAECLASLLYILFGCLATLTCTKHLDSSAHTLMVSLCFGLTVGTLVQCFQHISGAHLNPVVSLVHAVTCKVTPLRALLYAVAQTGGAVAGAAILHGITTGTCQAELGATLLQYGLSPWQGLGIELLLTFLFIFCVCATIDPNRTDGGGKALMIGFAMAGCHLAGFRFTGASMNPARSLGPAFVANKWSHHWIYWAGPVVGGVTAGLLYEFIFDPSRIRTRSQARAVPDPEIDLLTASAPPLPADSASSSSNARHYYNNNHSPHTADGSNLLGSPRSCRRAEVNLSGTAATTTTLTTSIPATTCTPNLYAPGTFGERTLIDIRDFRRPPPHEDPTSLLQPTLRRGGANDDVILPPPRRPPPQHDDAAIYGRRNPLNDVTPGRENQAYAFDSNPRRLQSPGASTPRDIMQMFSDGRETICLNDVRVF